MCLSIPMEIKKIKGSEAVAEAGGNVEDLTTRLESAPMAGHPLFHATGRVSLPADADPAVLAGAIEDLGHDLSQ